MPDTQCLSCNRGECVSVALLPYAHLHWACCVPAWWCVCVCVLQHGLESQFQGGNRSRWCQTGAQRELWCLNGGSVLPVSLVTRSVGTQRGLPVWMLCQCCPGTKNPLINPISSIIFKGLYTMVLYRLSKFCDPKWIFEELTFLKIWFSSIIIFISCFLDAAVVTNCNTDCIICASVWRSSWLLSKP